MINPEEKTPERCTPWGAALGSFPGSEMRRQHCGDFSEEVD